MPTASRLVVAAACLAVAVPARPASLRADLGTLGGTETQAMNLNDRGQIVGCSRTGAGALHAFLWDLAHGMVDLRIDAPGSCAVDVNDAGQVVGYAMDDLGSPTWAFLWEGGAVTNLGRGFAADINDVGQVLGVESPGDLAADAAGWVWESGRRRALPLPAGGQFIPVGINDAGRVVGSVCTVGCGAIVYDLTADAVATAASGLSGAHEQGAGVNASGQVLVQVWQVDASTSDSAFLWTDGALVPLGTLGGKDTGVMTWWWPPRHLNDRGDVVGVSEAADGGLHGFLWSAGEMLDLGPYLHATAINDAAQIAGEGWFPGATRIGAFVWTEGTAVPIGYPDLLSSALVINARGDALALYWDGAGHPRAFAWFASVADDVAAVGAISDALSLLAARGELTGSTVDALDAMLDAAGAQAARGESCGAARILGAFQTRVAALVRAGRLLPGSGQDLVDVAAQSAAALGGGC
jgi:probable HAF family extracellular repeat protein